MDTAFIAQLLSTLVALAVVSALAFLSLWGLKRLQQGRGGTPAANAGRLVLRQTLAVGTRERVVLVSLGERQWLLGTGPGGVTLLAELPPPPPAVDGRPTAVDGGPTG